MTEIELQLRKQIWSELSDFYLDTELSDEDLKHKADVFKQTGLSFEEIKDINYHEVGPLLKSNLNNIAGEWNNFDKSWLHNTLEILNRKERKQPSTILQKIDNYIDKKSIDWYTNRYLNKIKIFMK